MASKKQPAQGSKQGETADSGGTKGSQGGPQPSTPPVVRDEHYGVVSVLYHALQGADTISSYIQDATAAGDEELAEFFEEVKASYAEIAQEAKLHLASRIEVEEDDEEDEDDEGDEDEEEDEDGEEESED